MLEIELKPQEEELLDMYELNGFGLSVYQDDQKTIIETKQDSFY